MNLVIDASALLKAYLPDEASPQALTLMRDYALGRINLSAPRLLILDLLNACWVAARRGIINKQVLEDLVEHLASLQIPWIDVEVSAKEIFRTSTEFGITAYDAAYIVAAGTAGSQLVTGDKKLYHAVKDKLGFILLLANYTSEM